MQTIEIAVGRRKYSLVCEDDEEATTKAAAELFKTQLTEAELDVDKVGAARAFLIAGIRLADQVIELRASQEKLESEKAEYTTKLEQDAWAQEQGRETRAHQQQVLENLAVTSERVADEAEKLTSN